MKREVVSVSHPIVQKKIEKSLSLSVKEGALVSVASNFSMSYFSPAALALSASAVQMGILHAVISLLPSIVQLRSAGLIEKFSRKKIVFGAAVGKVLLTLPIFLIGFLHWIGVPYMVWAFIFLVGLHYISTAISHPAWFSWMGSLVPEKKRGRYFSRRNLVVGFFGVITMIVGALILDWVKRLGAVYGDVVGFTLIGFGILFILSNIARIWGCVILKKEYEPRLKIRKKDRSSLRDFLVHCRDTPFGRFSLVAGAFTFVVGISTPYWAVYMLRDLQMSYTWYMAITVSAIVFQLVFLPLLGKFSDRFGNIRLIKTSSIIVGLVPFLWIFSVMIGSDLWVKIYLLIVPAVVGGFAWAGYNLALNNYVYDAVGSRRRGFGLSYMNLLIGIGGFAGAGVGALIAWMNVSFMNPMLFIFMISGFGRLIVGYYGSQFLHEVRNVKKFSPQFWVKEFAPAQVLIREIHRVEHMAEKVEHYIIPEEREEFESNKLK
jgi:MFS family permease